MGNLKAKQIYEHSLPAGYNWRTLADSEARALETFLKDKYETKLYIKHEADIPTIKKEVNKPLKKEYPRADKPPSKLPAIVTPSVSPKKLPAGAIKLPAVSTKEALGPDLITMEESPRVGGVVSPNTSPHVGSSTLLETDMPVKSAIMQLYAKPMVHPGSGMSGPAQVPIGPPPASSKAFPAPNYYVTVNPTPAMPPPYANYGAGYAYFPAGPTYPPMYGAPGNVPTAYPGAPYNQNPNSILFPTASANRRS